MKRLTALIVLVLALVTSLDTALTANLDELVDRNEYAALDRLQAEEELADLLEACQDDDTDLCCEIRAEFN